MKRFLSFLIILSGIKSSGQTTIFCEALTDKTKSIFYIGVDNPIKIVTNNISENYSVNISGGMGTVDKINKDEFIIHANSVGECTVTISEKNKEVFQKTFNIYTISERITTLGGFRDTTISKAKIVANPSLAISFPNCYFQFNPEVTSVFNFQATFIKDGDSTKTQGQGNMFTQEQIKIMNTMLPGDKIYFDNIKSREADSRSTMLEPFWIKIK
ncbi:MAG: GldM family protein [Chitinophagaceae bacterium]